MPPARVVKRTVTDENAGTTGSQRLTRAKAAAITGEDVGDPPEKALGAKRTNTATSNGTLAKAKRTALGDVSNVVKKEPLSSIGVKKDAVGKVGMVSKTAKPSGIQKQPTRTSSQRTVLGQRTVNTTSSELKRPASGSGVGNIPKKRTTSATKSSTVEHEDESENVPPVQNRATTTPKITKKIETKPMAKPVVPLDPPVDIASEEEESLSEDDLENEVAKDLDSEDKDDPLMVAEYVHEIFDYMRQLEINTMPNPNYMANQDELEWKMRGILIDWLLEVHIRFRLLPETLFLAVNIIDRFLSCQVVLLDRLQLVGVTAMFIASKYEEVLSPHVGNFVHVADDGFTENEILNAERHILQTLNYDLSYPNPMNFLRRISKADNYDIQTRTVAKYLLEISCLDHRFLKYPPSHVAAASMYLARLVSDRGEWDATLTKYAGYSKAEIQPVFKLMLQYLAAPVTHEAFFKKYAAKKFYKASLVLRKWVKDYSWRYLG